MTTVSCPNCGAPVNLEGGFCWKCDRVLPADYEPREGVHEPP